MTLKSDWEDGDTFSASDQNDVAEQVNANTEALADKVDKITDPYQTYITDSEGDTTSITYTHEPYEWTLAVRENSGVMKVGTPTANDHAATKEYVDTGLSGRVPTTRQINGKSLSSNVTLTQDDIGDGTTNKVFTATEKTKLAGVEAGATANSADATLLNRANHTGTQSADTIVDGTTNKAFTATEKTKLAGIAAGATANDTDANLKNRANHTGTQAISTVTGLQTALDGKVPSTSTPLRTYVTNESGTNITVPIASAATATSVVVRDNNGRTQFATPSADADAATKGYVDSGLDEKKDTDAIRTGVFSFEMTTNQSNVWASLSFSTRREFMIPHNAIRFRVHIRNRNHLGDLDGGTLTNFQCYIGSPALDANGEWNGNFASTPVTLQTATTVNSGTEWVSSWVNPGTFTIAPYKRYVISYGFNCPASGNTCFGSGVQWQTFNTGASDAGQVSPAGLTRVTNAAFLQVWVEYEFADDDSPVMVVVSNSLSNGTNAGSVEPVGEIGSWPMIWAYQNRGVVAQLSAAAGLASDFGSGNNRWDVYDSCATPLDPDVVLYFALDSSDAINEGGTTITSTQAALRGAIAKGKSKFPNARHVITNIPPRVGFTGSGDTPGTLENARHALNAWHHLLPGDVEQCIDVDTLITDWADPARINLPMDADNTHFSPRGHYRIGTSMPAFGRRTKG